MSFVSASIAVHVQVSPAPAIGAFIFATFFCFAAVNDQISSTWTRFALTLRTLASWYPAQKRPASTSSLLTVLMLTSASRETERIEAPSHTVERIWTRWETGSLFMPSMV